MKQHEDIENRNRKEMRKGKKEIKENYLKLMRKWSLEKQTHLG